MPTMKMLVYLARLVGDYTIDIRHPYIVASENRSEGRVECEWEPPRSDIWLPYSSLYISNANTYFAQHK